MEIIARNKLRGTIADVTKGASSFPKVSRLFVAV
jgi:hypothetical protein